MFRYLILCLLVTTSSAIAETNLALISTAGASDGSPRAASTAQKYARPSAKSLVRDMVTDKWREFGKLPGTALIEVCADDLPNDTPSVNGSPCTRWPPRMVNSFAAFSPSSTQAAPAPAPPTPWQLYKATTLQAKDLASEVACIAAAKELAAKQKTGGEYSCKTSTGVSVKVDIPTRATPPPVVPPPTKTAAIKWHPGHYVWLDTLKSSAQTRAQHMAEIDALASDPAVKGILLGIYWGDLEGAEGDYSKGFAIIDEYMARSKLRGKRFMLRIYDRIFGGIEPADLDNGYYFPAYLKNYNGGWYSLPGGTALNTIVKTWDQGVMNRMIALTKAYGARYDSNPYFEMIGLEETSANKGVTGGGYTDAAYITQLKRWMSAARAAWPRTGVRLQLNYFLGARSECGDLAAFANANKIAMGGPDTIPVDVKDGLDWGDQAYLGTIGGVNYKDRIPMVAESQDYSLSSGFALPAIYGGGIARGAQYFVWYKNSFSKLQFATDILPYIRSIDGAVYSTKCPSSYGACNTN